MDPLYTYEKMIADFQEVSATPPLRMIPISYMTDVVSEEVSRSWKERLFSRPWRPFQKTRTVSKTVPSQRVLVMNGVVYAHPTLINKIRELMP